MKKRIWALILTSILLLACLAGCSGGKDSYAADTSYNSSGAYYSSPTASSSASASMAEAPMEAEYAYDEEAYEEADISSDSMLSTGELAANRKIIRNGNVNLETTEFAASVEKQQSLVTELGGYISQANVEVYNSYYQLHSASYTVRIPAEKFDSFISRRDSLGNATSTYVWTDDVTDSYFDMEARLDTLETKRARLLELLDQAEDMEDIITLESALSDTVFEIERITGSLRRLDDQISYSTIQVYLQEVRTVTETVTVPKTLGERISQEFQSTLSGLKEFGEDFIVWFIGALPVLLILAVVIIVVVLIVKRGAPRRAEKRARRAAENAQRQAAAVARWQAEHGVPSQPAPAEPEKK